MVDSLEVAIECHRLLIESLVASDVVMTDEQFGLLVDAQFALLALQESAQVADERQLRLVSLRSLLLRQSRVGRGSR